MCISILERGANVNNMCVLGHKGLQLLRCGQGLIVADMLYLHGANGVGLLGGFYQRASFSSLVTHFPNYRFDHSMGVCMWRLSMQYQQQSSGNGIPLPLSSSLEAKHLLVDLLELWF